MCSARSARATRSRSTCSISAASSLARCAAAGPSRRSAKSARYAARAEAVRPADRVVRRHQAQAGRDDRAHVRHRKPPLSNGRHDRRAHRPDDGRIPPRVGGARGLEEYAIEASIAKVAGSEVLNDVLDENIQVHGGNGYVRDYPAERHYRDSRVNRIFEGTNEINRLLIGGILARRAGKGELPIIAAAKALQDELMGPPAQPVADDTPLADERRAVEAFRKIALMVDRAGAPDLRAEALGRAGSADVRGRHSHRRVRRRQRGSSREQRRPLGRHRAPRFTSTRHACSSATRRFASMAAARQALAAMTDGDTLRTALAALRRLSKLTPVNTVATAAPAGGRGCDSRRVYSF